MNQHVLASTFIAADEESPPPAECRIPLVEAGAFACRFIIGEADEKAICCGAATDGKSWCSWHKRIVFEPRKPGRLR
jgi:hypothetical protein